jgi:hypothetical protein
MSATIARVRWVLFFVLHPKRLVALIGGLLTGALYMWFAAVRAAPSVRQRKAAARVAWRDRARKDPGASRRASGD